MIAAAQPTEAFDVFTPQASSIAGDVDALFFFMLAISGVICLILFVLVWKFSVRYWHNRSGVPREAHEPRGWRIEFIWTAIPLVIFVALFVQGASLYLQIETPPEDALQIQATARQWMWKFVHPGGQREIDALHLPVGQAVVVTLISQDVIHSFYVPAFRIKQDVLPRRYTRAWFVPVKTGRYRLFCAEFCGTGHSRMQGEVVIMPPAEYQVWLERNAAAPALVEQGERLFVSAGCAGCHAARSSVHAPRLAGLYGRVVHLSDGGTVTADDAYLRDSILLPDARVTAGYAPVMPSFAGQLGEDEVMKLVAYIKSLDEAEEGTDEPRP